MKIFNCILLIVFTSSVAISQQKIAITIQPKKIFIEDGEHKRFLNFDFIIKNNSADTVTISKVVVSVFDKQNKIIHQRFLDNNGTAPSIQTLPHRTFFPSQHKLVFNPFSEFSLRTALEKLEFEFTFTADNRQETVVRTTVLPEKYFQKIAFNFPLRGKVLAYDAHDFYSHHRRFDYEFEPISQLGITSNFMRYAYDFVLLDNANNQYNGSNEKAENYVGYGANVYAIADGKIIYASNKHADDGTFDVPQLLNNPLELYGNCIAIQHKDGSISIYGHLKQNSLTVKLNDVVKANQQIATIGKSGSSFFPHLHFEVRTSIKSSAEGLPSYFSNVFELENEKLIKLKSGLVETGCIVVAK